MGYQVGHLVHYQSDDPVFDNLESAERFALEASAGTDMPYGIWSTQEEGSEIIEIVYQGNFFKP